MATLVAAIDARKAKQGANEFTQAVDRMGREAKQSGRQVQQLDTKMDRLGRTGEIVKRQFAGLLAGVTAAMAVRGAIRVYSEYEETMKQVAGVTGATAEEMEKLAETARESGATTRFSASEAGQGLLFLARAGFEVEEAVAALPATLDLAIVGMIELGEAADIASNVATQFGLAADETSRIVDTLVTVANSANTDVQQLAQALSFAGVAAGKLGIDVETTAAAIGALGDAGIQSTRAGTGLRQFLVRLLQPTNEAEKGFKELGISLRDINPLSNEFVDILDRLASVDQGRLAELAPTLFGARQFSGALQLVNQAERIRELRNAAREAEGAGERLARFFSETLTGDIKSLISVTQELVLQLMEGGLAGALKTTVQFSTDVLRVFAGFTDELETNRFAVMAVVNAIRLLTTATAAYIALNLPAILVSTTSAMKTLVSTIQLGIAKVLAFTGPVGWLAIAIGAAATAVIHFREEIMEALKTQFEVEDRVVSVWSLVQATMEQGVEMTRIVLATLTWLWETTWNNLSEPIGDFVSTTWSMLKVGFNEWATLAREGLDVLLDLLQGWANQGIAIIVSMGETIGLIAGRIINSMKAMTDVLSDPTNADAWERAWGRMKDSFDIEAFSSDVKQVWKTNMEKDFLEDVRSFIDSWADTISTGLDLMVSDVQRALRLLAAADPEFREILQRLEATGGLSLTGQLETILDRAEQIQRTLSEGRIQAGSSPETEMVPRVSESPATLEGMVAPFLDEAINKNQSLQTELEKTLELLRGGATEDTLERQLELWKQMEEVRRALREEGLPVEQIEEEGLLDPLREQLEVLFKLEDQINKVREAREKDKEMMAEYEKRQQQFGQAMSQSFEDAAAAAILSGESIEDVLEDLSKAFLDLFLRQVVLQQVTSSVGNLFSGFFGSVTSAPTGSVPAAAGANGMFIERYNDGGFLNSPTYLNRRGKSPALVGEAGREAVFPVQIGPDGQFGVKASLPKESGSSTVNHTNYNITIQTPDANSFRQSEQQIASQMRRMQRRAGGPV